jgi:hypothetical protein
MAINAKRPTENMKRGRRLVFGVRLVRIVSVFGRVLNAIDHDDADRALR